MRYRAAFFTFLCTQFNFLYPEAISWWRQESIRWQ